MKIDLQRIPRNVIYLLLLVCLTLPFFLHWKFPVYVSHATRSLYETIEKVHKEKPTVPVVIFSCWDPSSRGENRPQLLALTRHLLTLRQPFVVFCPTLNPIAPRASEEVLNVELARAGREWAASTNTPFSCVYGVDYANLGFKGVSGPNIAPILQNLEGDFLGCVAQDLYGTPVKKLPILNGFTSLADASLILVVSGDIEAEHVIGVFSPRHPEIPVGAAGWSLICTRLYPYFDTGQLVGILDGMNGAGEYIELLEENYPSLTEDPEKEGKGDNRVNALTLARVLIISLIALGNLGMFLEKRKKAHSEIPSKPRQTETVGEKHYLNVTALCFTGIFLAALIVEYFLRRRAGLWSLSILGEWVAVFCTIGMISFIFGDNKLFRTLEHVIIGSSAAYLLFEVIDKQILPSFVSRVADGFAALLGRGTAEGSAWQLLLLLGVIPALFWFTPYFKPLKWTNKIVMGLLMGVGVGIAFGQNVNLAVPQIAGSIKPLLNFKNGPIFTWRQLESLIYLVSMILVMLYFIFCLKQKSTVAKGTLKAGRVIMMVAFGAVFGNTIATRMSWLIDRVDAVAVWVKSLMIFGGGL